MRGHGLHIKLGTAMMPSRVAIGASEPLPTATPATAIPSANPAAPARRWSTPLRSRSQLHLRHEIRQRLGLPGIGGGRRRPRNRNETNADCADCCGGNGIPRKAKESAAGERLIVVLLLLRNRCLGIKGVDAGEPLRVEPDSHRRSSPELRRQFDWLAGDGGHEPRAPTSDETLSGRAGIFPAS